MGSVGDMSRYQTSLKAIFVVLLIAFVADVIALAVPIGRTDPVLVAVLVYVFLLSTPLWLPFVIMFLPPTVARRLFKASAFLAILSLVFLVRHASDRDPWQFWSGRICGASLNLTFAVWLGHLGAKERYQRLNPDGRRTPAREVAEPDPRSPLWDRDLDR
jgi:hypothetical protein